MKFEWDANKNQTNFRKHGIAIESEPPLLVEYDDKEEHGEDRWMGLGLLRNHIIVVVFTEPTPETIRIISARKADQNERQKYFSTFRN
jgi:uncharacterized protein